VIAVRKALAVIKLFSVAIVFAIYAIIRALGVHGDLPSVVFLAVVAVTIIISEIERARLRKEGRGWPE
jgi:hypothetical protein